MADAKLKDRHRREIVTRLAQFDDINTVVADMQSEFGLRLTRFAVAYYDPTSTTGGRPAKKWEALFWLVRAGYPRHVDRIGAAHLTHRLRKLERWAQQAEEMGNLPLAAAMYRQAAEDLGGRYTNKQILATADPREELAKLLGVSVGELPRGTPDGKELHVLLGDSGNGEEK